MLQTRFTVDLRYGPLPRNSVCGADIKRALSHRAARMDSSPGHAGAVEVASAS